MEEFKNGMAVEINTVKDVVDLLKTKDKLALDTETFGLHETAKAFSLIIADEERGFYFNFQEYQDCKENQVLPEGTWDYLQHHLFNDFTKTWYMHNAKYDMKILRNMGCSLAGKIFCTQAQARLENNTHQFYNLDTCARRLGFQKEDKPKKWLLENKCFEDRHIPGKKKKFRDLQFEKVPFQIIAPYGCTDAYITYQLGEYLESRIKDYDSETKARGTRYNSSDISKWESRATKALYRMERTGIKIDREYIREGLEFYSAHGREGLDEFRNITGCDDYIDSGVNLARVFDRAGIAFAKGPKGNPCFDDQHLRRYSAANGDHPLPNAILKMREAGKMIGTYFSSYLHHCDYDNVIHPNYMQNGTVTGRLSCTDPNMQNVPREDSTLFPVRKCFIPRDGYRLVSIDYDQQEFRLMLDYAGEMGLIQEIKEGKDLHQATADMMGVDRRTAKTLTFGILYGLGVDRLAEKLECSPNQARETRAKFHARLPKVSEFINKVRSVGKTRGFVYTWAGRKLGVEDYDKSYRFSNYLIQGGCADVGKIALAEMDSFMQKEKLASRPILTIHDEFLFEIHESETGVENKFKEIMESVYEPSNGLKLSASITEYLGAWGEVGES